MVAKLVGEEVWQHGLEGEHVAGKPQASHAGGKSTGEVFFTYNWRVFAYG